MKKPLLAAIEAGGTKFNLAVGYGFDDSLRQVRIVTNKPAQTLAECADFFRQAETDFGGISALGIAAFGPINLNKNSPRYGTILNTPKPEWSNVNLIDFFSAQLECPIALDSDVNAAALAEHTRRGGSGNLVYITVGTGVGVGVCIDGITLKGQLHPELGHLVLDQRANEKSGICPAHGNCVEGLVSGTALKQRWDVNLESVAADHPLWESSAYYLARLCSTITLAYSPFKIVIGGGVTNSGSLLKPLQAQFAEMMQSYLPDESFPGGIEHFIDTPGFNESAGLAGAFLLAKNKYHEKIN